MLRVVYLVPAWWRCSQPPFPRRSMAPGRNVERQHPAVRRGGAGLAQHLDRAPRPRDGAAGQRCRPSGRRRDPPPLRAFAHLRLCRPARRCGVELLAYMVTWLVIGISMRAVHSGRAPARAATIIVATLLWGARPTWADLHLRMPTVDYRELEFDTTVCSLSTRRAPT